MRLPFLLLALLAAAPALADKRLAVLEFRNKMTGSDKQKVDSGYFTDQVRARQPVRVSDNIVTDELVGVNTDNEAYSRASL